MIVKTKKYQLDTSTYIKLGMKNIVKEQWWVFLIALAIASGYFIEPSVWWFVGAGVGLLLYLLFWLVQFAGITQLEQGKMLFEKLSYEIDSRQILIKLNPRQGMPVTWDMVKKVQKGKEGFLFFLSKAQIIFLPYKIFKTENEVRFVETILKRKGLLK